jgi:alkyl sulfatase BDS1-like metallo-beta-lactamase superfamily hydrolase
MPMPKGYKSEHGYATNKTFSGGEDYRTIANVMTQKGYKMNHATARNVFLSALRKIAKPVHQINDLPVSEDTLQKTAKDPRFQAGVAEILSSINAPRRIG